MCLACKNPRRRIPRIFFLSLWKVTFKRKRGKTMMQSNTFLKWAGGKQRILDELIRRTPKKFNHYYEPFLGSGSLFFALEPKSAFIADINRELMTTFKVVKNKLESLVLDLDQHQNSKEYFLYLRDAPRRPEYQNWSDVKRASRFIFLNKTGFNGLYRVNSDGFCNTPFAYYKNPKIYDFETLYSCQNKLKNSKLICEKYYWIEQFINQGDFVYFDPPYIPTSKTSNFTKYDKGDFASKDQRELRDLCIRLDKKGVYWMLSNSDHQLVWDYFKSFRTEKISVLRSINNSKIEISELIVRNY